MAESAGHFADRLRTLREDKGLSQYALAKLSGLSKQAVSNLELGNREPTWQTVQLLAAALGVDCTAFADLGVRPPPAEAPKLRGRPRKDGGTAAEGKPAAKKGKRR